MPSSFGITTVSAGGAIVESADTEMKADFKQLIDSTGHYAQAISYDLTYSFSVRGKGDASPAAAGSDSGTSLTSGVVIVTSSKQSSKNDEYRSYEYSGTAWAFAS